MIRRLVVSAALVTFCLSGCDRQASPPQASVDAADVAEQPAQPAVPSQGDAPKTPQPAVEAKPLTTGAPVFAVLYPGSELDGPPTIADGQAGEGGLVTFKTAASPDAVVAFYRQHAEAAGLRSVMGMNQGDARAYGAAGEGVNGAILHVVAAPTEDEQTSVQLSWSAGQ